MFSLVYIFLHFRGGWQTKMQTAFSGIMLCCKQFRIYIQNNSIIGNVASSINNTLVVVPKAI